MAAVQNNIIILNEAEYRFSLQPVLVTSGGVSTIQSGTPTKGADATAASSWTGAVIPMVTGGGTTSDRFTGICKTTSNETASANGTAVVWLPLPGLVYACAATTASNANTAALVQALFGKRVTLTLASSLWTVNTAAADAAANMVTIVGGDFNTSKIYFTYKATGTVLGQIV